MTRRAHYPLALAAALALASPARATAQQSAAVLKYGKWGALAAAVGLGIQAAARHSDADRAYNRLKDYCFIDDNRCDLGSNGHYLDPVTEGYYQTTLRNDRSARRWLVGGEVALASAVALFVWDFARPKSPPPNIPFHPELKVLPRQTTLGVRLEF
jgi:hypothetical protein